MWPRSHRQGWDWDWDWDCTPSPHGLPTAGNAFPSRSRRQGHLERWQGQRYPCWGNTATSWLPVHSLHRPHLNSAQLPDRLSALALRMPIAGRSWASTQQYKSPQGFMGCHNLRLSSLSPHRLPLATPLQPALLSPSGSSPILEHTGPALAPGLRTCHSLCLGCSCPRELDSLSLISFRSLLT